MSTHGKPFAAHVASCHLIRCLLPLLQVSLGGLLSSGHFELEHDLHALMRGIKDSLLSCCVAFLFFFFFWGGLFYVILLFLNLCLSLSLFVFAFSVSLHAFR
jgi:hypothetical protein